MQIAGWSKLVPVSWNVVSLLVGLLAQQAVVASIEEFTFRGVLQSLLIKRWGTSAGLAIAAFLFGLWMATVP